MTVEQLKTERSNKKSSFNAYAKRRNSINDIIDKIGSKFDDDINAVNKQIDNCIYELQCGLRGTSSVSTVCNNLELAKEKTIWSDYNISTCKSNLIYEKNRCQSRINELDATIKSLEKQITDQGGTIYFWE